MDRQHIGNHPADPANTDDDGARGIVIVELGLRLVLFDAPGQPPSGPCQKRCDREADGGDDLPELRGAGLDQQSIGRRRQHNQRGFRWAGHQDASLGRKAAVRTHQAQRNRCYQRLEHQHCQGRQQDRGKIVPDHPQVDAHPDRDQEHPEREALEWRGDPLNLGVIFSLGDQQSGQ